MLIRTWSLIPVVVIVISALWWNLWDEIRELALLLFGLLVFASILASMYFFSRGDIRMTLIVSLPWMAGTAWGVLDSYIHASADDHGLNRRR
jgi:hypothetical protein